MTADRTIVAAYAENHRGLARRRVRKILTASLAAVLTMPSLAAWAIEVQNSKAKLSRSRYYRTRLWIRCPGWIGGPV
jgi:hypothetical protein